MSPQTPKQRHAALCAEIARHDHAYYVLDAPVISDRTYDKRAFIRLPDARRDDALSRAQLDVLGSRIVHRALDVNDRIAGPRRSRPFGLGHARAAVRRAGLRGGLLGLHSHALRGRRSPLGPPDAARRAIPAGALSTVVDTGS